MNSYFIVELEPGVWLAPWRGDPGRTLREENAKHFWTYGAAENALQAARLHRSFKKAQILACEEGGAA